MNIVGFPLVLLLLCSLFLMWYVLNKWQGMLTTAYTYYTLEVSLSFFLAFSCVRTPLFYYVKLCHGFIFLSWVSFTHISSIVEIQFTLFCLPFSSVVGSDIFRRQMNNGFVHTEHIKPNYQTDFTFISVPYIFIFCCLCLAKIFRIFLFFTCFAIFHSLFWILSISLLFTFASLFLTFTSHPYLPYIHFFSLVCSVLVLLITFFLYIWSIHFCFKSHLHARYGRKICQQLTVYGTNLVQRDLSDYLIFWICRNIRFVCRFETVANV